MPHLSLPNPPRDMPSRTRRSYFLRSLSVAAFAVTTLAACRSEDQIRAQTQNQTDTLTAYALSGASMEYPSALNTVSMVTVPINGVGVFDVAFDFNPLTPTDIQVIPIRQIVTPFTATIPSIGLLAVPESFEDVERAPDTYYRPDTTLVVQPGETFIIQSFRSAPGVFICLYIPQPRIFTKVVIDSVKTTIPRAIYLRQTVNPNCGYRSFLDGIPAN